MHSLQSAWIPCARSPCLRPVTTDQDRMPEMRHERIFPLKRWPSGTIVLTSRPKSCYYKLYNIEAPPRGEDAACTPDENPSRAIRWSKHAANLGSPDQQHMHDSLTNVGQLSQLDLDCALGHVIAVRPIACIAGPHSIMGSTRYHAIMSGRHAWGRQTRPHALMVSAICVPYFRNRIA